MRALISKHICMTKDIGGNGNLFGGILLSWLDESGAIAAMEYVGDHRMVTLKMNEVVFKKAVKVHDIVYIYGDIVKVGNTSITVKIEAYATRELPCAESELVAATEMVFVRVDEEGKPTPITGVYN